MGWLGNTIPGTAGPGTSGMVYGSGHGAMVGANPGVTWGGALGAGALAGPGYSILGSMVGLPQSQYSGITAGLGGTAGFALGSSSLPILGAMGGPLGMVIGGLLGGLGGGLFGGGGDDLPPKHRTYSAWHMGDPTY